MALSFAFCASNCASSTIPPKFLSSVLSSGPAALERYCCIFSASVFCSSALSCSRRDDAAFPRCSLTSSELRAVASRAVSFAFSPSDCSFSAVAPKFHSRVSSILTLALCPVSTKDPRASTAFSLTTPAAATAFSPTTSAAWRAVSIARWARPPSCCCSHV